VIKASNNYDANTSQNLVPSITHIQSKYSAVFCSQMWPDPSINHHPVFPMIQNMQWRDSQSTVESHGPENTWKLQFTKDYTFWPRHHKQAAACLRGGTGKNTPRICQDCKLGQKDNNHSNLKVVAFAAVPHKNWLLEQFWTCHINEPTLPMSDYKAMDGWEKTLETSHYSCSNKTKPWTIVFGK